MHRKARAYRGFRSDAHNIGTAMGRAIGLSPDIIHEAIRLYEKTWKEAPRTPQGVMVDCLYVTANKYGAKTTTRTFAKRLRELYGVGTEPLTSWMECN